MIRTLRPHRPDQHSHDDTGHSLGARHQAGWTASAPRCIGEYASR